MSATTECLYDGGAECSLNNSVILLNPSRSPFYQDQYQRFKGIMWGEPVDLYGDVIPKAMCERYCSSEDACLAYGADPDYGRDITLNDAGEETGISYNEIKCYITNAKSTDESSTLVGDNVNCYKKFSNSCTLGYETDIGQATDHCNQCSNLADGCFWCEPYKAIFLNDNHPTNTPGKCLCLDDLNELSAPEEDPEVVKNSMCSAALPYGGEYINMNSRAPSDFSGTNAFSCEIEMQQLRDGPFTVVYPDRVESDAVKGTSETASGGFYVLFYVVVNIVSILVICLICWAVKVCCCTKRSSSLARDRAASFEENVRSDVDKGTDGTLVEIDTGVVAHDGP
jgi:hypothetical protein